MNEEFPQLDPVPHQEKFLEDWWSPKKLFRGKRATGKTTLMACEVNRLMRNSFDTIFAAPTETQIDNFKNSYYDLFGERLTCNTVSLSSPENVRGCQCEALVIDELQEISFDDLRSNFLPMNPVLFRASACKSSMNGIHYLENDTNFFDSFYDSSVDIRSVM